MDENAAEATMREHIRVAVACGYDSLDDIRDDAADYLVGAYEGLDDAALARMAARLVPEVAREHAEAQTTWPEITDCDRLEEAFKELEKSGICCGANEGWDRSGVAYEMMQRIARMREEGEAVRGYVFFSEQDVEQAVHGNGLALAFGRVEREADLEPDVAIGTEVKDFLRKRGFIVHWPGELGTRILIELEWRKRGYD